MAKKKVFRLGKMHTTKRRWTEVEKAFLRDNAATTKDEDIAKHLRRGLKAIREMRRRMGIIKQSGRGIVALRKDN